MPIVKLKTHPTGTPPPQAFPEILAQVGPALAVQVEVPPALAKQLTGQGQQLPQPVTGLALIDTGASISAVDQAAIIQLGVSATGLADVRTPAGPTKRNLYPIRIVVPQIGLGLDFNEVIDADLSGLGYVALLGREVLQQMHMILIYDAFAGEVTLAW